MSDTMRIDWHFLDNPVQIILWKAEQKVGSGVTKILSIENGAANGLKPENGQLLQEFEAIKTAILKATSKRGHTQMRNKVLQIYRI